MAVSPTLSFCIPALNEEVRIGRCVRSIKSELLRAGLVLCKDAEIIVVDNGSTDSTAYVAAVNGARVVSEPHRGLLRARNAGYHASKGRLIANIDADCLLRPGWIDRALYAFRDSNITAVSGPYRYYDLPIGKYAAGSVFGVYGALNRCGMATMMGGNSVIRRDVLEAIGGYNTDIEFWGEDTWTAVQCSKYGKVKFDLGLVVDSSGRRLVQDGYFKTFGRYLLNHFAIRVRGSPANTVHREVR